MIEQTRLDAVQQKKMDALSTKYLHEKHLTSLRKLNSLVDYLAIGVPILYFSIRLLAKGTSFGPFVEFGWEVLASILLALAVLKVIYKWSERAEGHNKLIAENISLVSHAEYLLTNPRAATSESIRWFLLLADNSEKADREALGVVKDKERQYAYREALKEINPGSTDTRCPKCGASPWEFATGSCQLCGNTPRSSNN